MIPGITADDGHVAAGGGGAALWTPAEITTQLWFDAADIATITIGTGVSQWSDKSGNARHVTQATGANQPAYNAVQLNSQAVLTFDSTDALRKTSASAGLLQNVSAATLYTVRRFTDLSGAGFPVVLAIADSTTTTGRAAAYMSQSDDVERMGGIRTDGQAFQNTAVSAAVDDVWNQQAAHFSYGLALVSAFKNGTLALGPTNFQDAGNTSNTAPATIGVGCWVDGTLNLIGDIAEIIVTHKADPTERGLVEGYLAWKWGLQGDLPASHRFKSAPPLVGDSLTTGSLLHFDAADGSTTFTDQRGVIWTPAGDAQIDTAQFKFGSGSLLIDASGDWLDALDPTFAVGPGGASGLGDFTAQGFMRLAAFTGNHFMFGFGAGWGVYALTFNGGFALFDGVASNPIIGFNGGVSTGVWYHVALVRKDGVFTLYINGNSIGTAANTTNFYQGNMRLGAQTSGSGALNGWIDEWKFSRTAEYTANFTPPAGPFT